MEIGEERERTVDKRGGREKGVGGEKGRKGKRGERERKCSIPIEKNRVGRRIKLHPGFLMIFSFLVQV